MNRPRGLCWNCYYAPGVLALYPSTSKFARRGTRNYAGERPLPVPTTVLPGTEAKKAVLAERAEAGLALFHPEDPRIEQPVGTRERKGEEYRQRRFRTRMGRGVWGDMGEWHSVIGEAS